MSSKMDIEESGVGQKADVHPLALVHMSDHYTRVTMGGSPWPKDAPVVGLLFGHGTAIVDAEDVPLQDPVKAVELHQAVFPNNIVMGCYRVTPTEAEPTKEDIRQVQALHLAFRSGPDDKNNVPFYFGLLQVNPKAKDGQTNDQEASLPLQLFIFHDSVLVAVDDWLLTTKAEAERIAVERVLRDKPQQDDNDEAKQAWCALDVRLQQLVEYLQQSTAVSSSSPPPPPQQQQMQLWRQIKALLMQAHLLRSQVTPSAGTSFSVLPQQVVALAKTVDSIAFYTDKFRLLHETKGAAATAASIREVRRF